MADSSVSQSQLSEEFMKDFNARKDNLSTQISKLSLESGIDVNKELSKISSEIQNISKSLHDAVMFLPSYSVKVVVFTIFLYSIFLYISLYFYLRF